MTADGKGLLSTREAAKYLSVSPETMERWRQKDPASIRYPRFFRLGDAQNSRVRYSVKDLDLWLQRRRASTSMMQAAASA